MEKDILPSPAVAGVLAERFVEARLHTDGTEHIERILEVQSHLTGSLAMPYYLVIDPDGEG